VRPRKTDFGGGRESKLEFFSIPQGDRQRETGRRAAGRTLLYYAAAFAAILESQMELEEEEGRKEVRGESVSSYELEDTGPKWRRRDGLLAVTAAAAAAAAWKEGGSYGGVGGCNKLEKGRKGRKKMDADFSK
jgi:hypothetical protein